MVSSLGAILLLAPLFLLSVGAFAEPASPHDKDVKALDNSNPAEREKAAQRLIKGSQSSVPALLDGLDSSSLQVKAKVLRILREIKWKAKGFNNESTARSIGLKARQEPDPNIRQDMVMALRDLPGPAAEDELKRLAVEDADEEVRRLSTHFVATVSLSPDKETALFRKQTADKSVLVQLAAFNELAKLGDNSGRNLALKVLKAGSRDVDRIEAMKVLGACGNPDDVSLLKALYQSEKRNGEVKQHALEAYTHIELLQVAAGEKLHAMIKALDDPDENVRHAAFLELYHSTDPNTNDALKKYLHETGHIGYSEAAHALSVR